MNGGLSERILAQGAEPEALETMYRADPGELRRLPLPRDPGANGFTPNRTVTLVSNVLILANLAAIVGTFTRPAFRGLEDVSATQRAIATFLPIYSAWTAFVVFALPAIFRFR